LTQHSAAFSDSSVEILKQPAPRFERGKNLRARGKRERRRRLSEAAREVFLERGYDGATTREIAARADVAIGTLFVYAPEKRDLLFLVMNDDLDAIVDTMQRTRAYDRPLMDQLLAVFQPLFRYFEKNVTIARYGIHEIFLFQDVPPETLGPEAHRVADRADKIRALLADIVERLKSEGRSEGRLATQESGQTIAKVLLWIHLCHAQVWILAKAPKASAGVKELMHLFSMTVRGLGPKPNEI
jgi:AcrR family transcriptional regulator